MPHRFFWRISLLLVLSAGCANSGQRSAPVAVSTTYTNPLPVRIADPFVYREGSTYYLYGTSAYDGLYGWTSKDLVHWKPHGYVIRRSENTWSQRNFWAPELFKHRGKYYLHFTAARGEPLQRRIVLAVANSPLGPFRELKAPWFEPGINTIDSHVFRDDDGRLYLYSVQLDRPPEQRKFEIRVRELDENLEPGEESTLCITPSEPWEGGVVTEGPYVLRRGSTYLMTYSGMGYLSPDYAVGIATAKSPLGPWKKSSDDPILRRIPGVSGPGHHSFAMSPDSKEMFIVYHVHEFLDRPGNRRVLSMDRVHFVDGDPPTLKVDGPTITPQPMPSGAR
jgi:beta-xylosidase